MIIIFLILIIAAVSIIWAFISLRKERQKHEIEAAKKDLSKGRVIYHSSETKSS